MYARHHLFSVKLFINESFLARIYRLGWAYYCLVDYWFKNLVWLFFNSTISLLLKISCSTLITGWMPTLLRAGRGMTLWEKARADPPPKKLELFSYENNPVIYVSCLGFIYMEKKKTLYACPAYCTLQFYF